MGENSITLPYWQVNVPENLRTAECPEFLEGLSEKDRGIISTPDSQYRTDTWEEVKAKVSSNHLELFQRQPSDLRRYRAFVWGLKKDYGSVLEYILTQRLRWEEPVVPKGGKNFEDPADYKILRNDWPYGIDERIVHLVVWTRFDLAEDPQTGDLTDEARAAIEAFVHKTFGRAVPRDQYVWFKNWSSLKSVHAVEHLHVMVFDPDPAFIHEVTGGDIAQSDRFVGWDP